jgi:PAP2 superfamily protein
VKRKGARTSDARTLDESHYAAFWYELSDIGWNRIARVVWRENRQDLWTTARTFALLNAALADSYIAGWDSKMHYNFWRPISAIRLAADDGNRVTTPDTAWEPFLTTPPVQDYPSTHSVLGAAGAAVLAHAFGRDDIAFTFTSLSADSANPVRSFRSFSEAARENAESRVMAGIHFRFAIEAGLGLGQDIGRYTVRTLLRPTPAVSDSSNE